MRLSLAVASRIVNMLARSTNPNRISGVRAEVEHKQWAGRGRKKRRTVRRARAGRPETLVNNAGISGGGPIELVPVAAFRQTMETNFFGSLRCWAHEYWRCRRSQLRSPCCIPSRISGVETRRKKGSVTDDFGQRRLREGREVLAQSRDLSPYRAQRKQRTSYIDLCKNIFIALYSDCAVCAVGCSSSAQNLLLLRILSRSVATDRDLVCRGGQARFFGVKRLPHRASQRRTSDA
jgi:hypothetical protein